MAAGSEAVGQRKRQREREHSGIDVISLTYCFILKSCLFQNADNSAAAELARTLGNWVPRSRDPRIQV